jgi:hypothetical protein
MKPNIKSKQIDLMKRKKWGRKKEDRGGQSEVRNGELSVSGWKETLEAESGKVHINKAGH